MQYVDILHFYFLCVSCHNYFPVWLWRLYPIARMWEGGILYKHCRKDCGLMPRWRQQDKKLRGMLRHFCWLLMECLLCCAAAELFFNVCPKGLICFHVRATYANAPQQHCVLTPMHLSDSSFLFPLLLIALSQQKLANAGLQIRPGSDKLRFWTYRNLEFFPWVSNSKFWL